LVTRKNRGQRPGNWDALGGQLGSGTRGETASQKINTIHSTKQGRREKYIYQAKRHKLMHPSQIDLLGPGI